MIANDKPKVAFVLSGGASLGAIQAGMLRALYERGIKPDVIVGTSAGAMNGAFIGSRPQTVATADALATVWRDLKRGEVCAMKPAHRIARLPRYERPPRPGVRATQADRPQHRARS